MTDAVEEAGERAFHDASGRALAGGPERHREKALEQGKLPVRERVAKLTELLKIRTGNKRLNVTRVEPVRDSEGELEGYMAFARP